MKKRIQLNGIAIAVSLIAVAVFPDIFIRRSAGAVDEIIGAIGICLILLGQLLRVSARGYKAQHSRGGHCLIEAGPYGMVRHPMYLGIIVIGIGSSMYILKLWVVILFVLIFLLRYHWLFKEEDKELSRVFKDQYATYKKRVPLIFPRLSVLLKEDFAKYLPLKASWFWRESISIVPTLVIVVALKFSAEFTQRSVTALMRDAVLLLLIFILYLLLILFLVKRYENRAA